MDGRDLDNLFGRCCLSFCIDFSGMDMDIFCAFESNSILFVWGTFDLDGAVVLSAIVSLVNLTRTSSRVALSPSLLLLITSIFSSIFVISIGASTGNCVNLSKRQPREK